MEQKIISDLRECYGLACEAFTPVTGGWLNEKWKITSRQGAFLVKIYSQRRFNREQLRQIDIALQRQRLLERNGVPCPHILPVGDHALRVLDGETTYMVMEFCPGVVESRETVTERQMNSLGQVCGLLRREFGKLPAEGVKGFPIQGRQWLDSLWEHFHACVGGFTADTPEAYRKAVLDQEAVLRGLTADGLDRLPKGIGHEDFSPDNMLFHEKGVAAILDFDRNQYGFVWHDAGRCLLSLALEDGGLNLKKVDAFLEGYSTVLPLTRREIVDALRIVWYVEFPWWIRPAFFDGKIEKTTRFRDEVLWLGAHWFELDELLLD